MVWATTDSVRARFFDPSGNLGGYLTPFADSSLYSEDRIAVGIDGAANAVIAGTHWLGDHLRARAARYSLAKSQWEEVQLGDQDNETTDVMGAVSPLVAMNEAGHAVVLWGKLHNAKTRLFAATYQSSWTTSRALGNAFDDFAARQGLTLAADGSASVIWTYPSDGSMWWTHFDAP